MPNVTFDEKGLKKMMVDADLNKSQLVEKAKISKPTLSAIIRGESVQISKLQSVAYALNRPLSDIMALYNERSD